MPKISVIVPVYKVEKYLHECVDSILAQTYSDFELILVDDGSPDNCGKICDEYAAKDSRIRVIHQENQGLSGARNAALDVAMGDFIAFIDSDDVVNVHYLEVLLSGMDEDTDIVACPYVTFSNVPAKTPVKLGELSFEKFDAVNSIIALHEDINRINASAGGKLLRTNTIGDLRFPVGRVHEDQYFMPLVFYQAKNVVHCHLALYYYRTQSESIMHSAFSVKRFDGIWAIDSYISFFRKKREGSIVRAAKKLRMRKLAVNNIYARNAKIVIPSEYRLGTMCIIFYLFRTMEPERCQYYLAQIHPCLALLHQYWIKIKKILHIS